MQPPEIRFGSQFNEKDLTMSKFIFMLTHNDVTVANAREVFDSIADLEIPYVGFKDIGLPINELKALAADIRSNGQKVMLEVVSEKRDDELRSLRAGLDIGVDYVLGGTHVTDGVDILNGSGVAYMPFPGEIVDHPSKLRGTIESITESARELAQTPGVAGLDLLAYRFAGDVPALISSVVQAVDCPVIAAGSIASTDRISTVSKLGAWGFTVGSAAFEGQFDGGKSLKEQLTTILKASHNTVSATR